ncbi:hypothetical protein ELQ90_03065 [Labedella phragmitis]|uniref:Uncharacterized protein n=1 Tax=Labedella phragmitis TaxID=2498849 RepID=A0A444PYG8_9MICO|nr:hypothetical protein [Labedella phragmitis]RWZ52930.1 hypothetical protein ELQ90_03065 [Labedella phragmitis]
MSAEIELPGLEKTADSRVVHGGFGVGATEAETRAAIAELEDESGPLTGPKRTIKQLCISLAQSIDKGNNKGRAIANEAAQLFAMMQQLAPPETEQIDDSHLSPELRRLLDAFAAPAQLDPAPEGHPA